MVEHNQALRNSKLNKKETKKIDIKKALAAFMIITILTLSFTAYKINEINTRAFTVFLGEENLGLVRTEEEALKIMTDIRRGLNRTYDADCVIDKELSFQPTHAKDDELISAAALKTAINSKIDFLVSGYSLRINGEDIGFLKSQEDAQAIVDEIKAPYLEGIEGELKEVKVLEDVLFVKSEFPLNKISQNDKLVEHIKLGEDEIKTHIVEAGESFWTIAMIYDTTVDELIAANPDVNPQKMKPGDEVKLVVPASLLTVATTTEIQYNEETEYETIIEKDPNMYTNQKKTKVEGQYGESHIVANEIKHNGILVEKQIISEEVIKEPVAEVIIKGTKELPKTAATGTFMMPTRGRFTSGYGSRWGRLHRGIDIAASTGTPIYAADGGTVTHSGWQGTYGYMVEIDHGNGLRTRYAHASKLIVKVGTKVYKGQHIANVGNTGRSTGPHLHLEVLKNGVHVNPSKYF